MENKGNFVLREKSGETAKAVFNENIEKSQCSNLDSRHGCKNGEEPPSSDALEASWTTSVAWFHKALWVIYNAAAAGAILITVIFWCLLFNESHGISAFSIIVHGVNAALVISETLLSSIPVRLLHVVYPMCLGIVYIVFTLVYWVSGGTNRFGMPYIYPQTDYTGRPVFSAISQLCLLFIGVPLSQCLIFCFYGLRVWIKAKYAK